MKKDNKIISFRKKTNIISFEEARKNRKKTKKDHYQLLTSITLNIKRDIERYTTDLYSSNLKLTKEQTLEILKVVFLDLSAQTGGYIKVKKEDTYNLSITLHYYDDVDNPEDFKYIYDPPSLDKEDLANYLFEFLGVYDYLIT